MDEFNFDEPERKSTQFSMPTIGLWDVLTFVVLLMTACIGFYFITIFNDPGSSLNLLKPGYILTPSPTITPIQMEPTWTVTATVVIPPTETLLPSITPPPTSTLANLVPDTATPVSSETPTPTATPKALFSVSSINSIESVIIPHLLNASCNWQGVGGTVDDQNSSPIIGIVVRLGGRLDGKSVEMTTVSGISPEYGKSGFEFVLGDTPIDSNDTLYVQLLDQAGLPLSDRVFIDTSSDCQENLVLVRFKKNR